MSNPKAREENGLLSFFTAVKANNPKPNPNNNTNSNNSQNNNKLNVNRNPQSAIPNNNNTNNPKGLTNSTSGNNLNGFLNNQSSTTVNTNNQHNQNNSNNPNNPQTATVTNSTNPSGTANGNGTANTTNNNNNNTNNNNSGNNTNNSLLTSGPSSSGLNIKLASSNNYHTSTIRVQGIHPSKLPNSIFIWARKREINNIYTHTSIESNATALQGQTLGSHNSSQSQASGPSLSSSNIENGFVFITQTDVPKYTPTLEDVGCKIICEWFPPKTNNNNNNNNNNANPNNNNNNNNTPINPSVNDNLVDSVSSLTAVLKDLIVVDPVVVETAKKTLAASGGRAHFTITKDPGDENILFLTINNKSAIIKKNDASVLHNFRLRKNKKNFDETKNFFVHILLDPNDYRRFFFVKHFSNLTISRNSNINGSNNNNPGLDISSNSDILFEGYADSQRTRDVIAILISFTQQNNGNNNNLFDNHTNGADHESSNDNSDDDSVDNESDNDTSTSMLSSELKHLLSTNRQLEKEYAATLISRETEFDNIRATALRASSERDGALRELEASRKQMGSLRAQLAKVEGRDPNDPASGPSRDQLENMLKKTQIELKTLKMEFSKHQQSTTRVEFLEDDNKRLVKENEELIKRAEEEKLKRYETEKKMERYRNIEADMASKELEVKEIRRIRLEYEERRKLYEDLQQKFLALETQNKDLIAKLDQKQILVDQAENERSKLQEEIKLLKQEIEGLNNEAESMESSRNYYKQKSESASIQLAKTLTERSIDVKALKQLGLVKYNLKVDPNGNDENNENEPETVSPEIQIQKLEKEIQALKKSRAEAIAALNEYKKNAYQAAQLARIGGGGGGLVKSKSGDIHAMSQGQGPNPNSRPMGPMSNGPGPVRVGPGGPGGPGPGVARGPGPSGQMVRTGPTPGTGPVPGRMMGPGPGPGPNPGRPMAPGVGPGPSPNRIVNPNNPNRGAPSPGPGPSPSRGAPSPARPNNIIPPASSPTTTTSPTTPPSSLANNINNFFKTGPGSGSNLTKPAPTPTTPTGSTTTTQPTSFFSLTRTGPK